MKTKKKCGNCQRFAGDGNRCDLVRACTHKEVNAENCKGYLKKYNEMEETRPYKMGW